MRRYIIFTLLILLFSSCATQNHIHYYSLADDDSVNGNINEIQTNKTQTNKTQIVLNVILPDYLNTENIAYQDDDVRLSLAQSNLWAENPESAIKRLLINDLSKRQPQIIWLSNKTTDTYNQKNILVSLDKFNGQHGGQALISGRYFIRDSKQNIIAIYPFNIKVAQYGNGYAALARALNQGVHQLAVQISNKRLSVNEIENKK